MKKRAEGVGGGGGERCTVRTRTTELKGNSLMRKEVEKTECLQSVLIKALPAARMKVIPLHAGRVDQRSQGV